MKHQLYFGVALAALSFSSAAYAQSTGTIDAEEEIIVTASSAQADIAGVTLPETSKARAVLTQEFIARQAPGQSINDIINQLPGVSFQNNDPFGSAGGKLTIRGFDNSRINQTFDGIPLNDTGNYQLYSSQQLDSELIQQVNVNLGSTDVDSPSAAASGSTVNYRMRNPKEEFGARLTGATGDFGFFRIFGVVDTGIFTSVGTRAFLSASHSENKNVFNNSGQIDKNQINGRIYQPIGDNGDFISISGHYSESRNNFFGSVPLRVDQVGTLVVPNRFPVTNAERFYTIAPCQINTVARPGTADVANTCGSTFDERFNPSNTGNIRLASRFTLSDGLVLSVDPSFQYVKANGGGTVVAQEGFRDVNPAGGTATPNACVTAPGAVNTSCQTGYIAGIPYFGRDLNGDTDLLDTVRVLAPSQTQTRRYGLIASLRYDINDNHMVRVSYTLDYGRHRQTGEVGTIQVNGVPDDVFPVNNPLSDGARNILQKRDRLSYAILNQIGGEYRGKFFDDRMIFTAGVRAPFVRRELNNYCATSSASGFVECFGTNTAGLAAYQQFNPTVTIGAGASAATSPLQGPQQRILKYNRVLPNVGFTFDLDSNSSIFVNYSKGVQVPRTDTLYNSFYFVPGSPQAQPRPETTDNFDFGVRYRSSKLLAQFSAWYTKYKDRLAEAYDPDLDRSVFRNLGSVDKYGIDGSIAYSPIPEISLYVFGSALKSKIKDNLLITELNNGTQIFSPTAGKRESGAPVYTIGGRVQGNLGPVELGVQAKRTGERYVNDSNLPVYTGAASTVIYPAFTPAYTLVDLDARVSLEFLGLNKKTFFQLNVSNLFDELYVGGFDGGNQSPVYNAATGALTGYTSPIFVQIGAPRTVMGSFTIEF